VKLGVLCGGFILTSPNVLSGGELFLSSRLPPGRRVRSLYAACFGGDCAQSLFLNNVLCTTVAAPKLDDPRASC
jgi:hypothetical protein